MSIDVSPIAAIATAPGRGGIGVVRLSGKNLWPVIAAVCGKQADQLQPRHATYLPFLRA
ncbi:MAG TPA: tRNA uridine-5-carboxymethylaminomethyl(34) synthesis GTPase MnmE, partial [Herbaspirillum sp.]|nr:tRNA uridine-5-carboxymethylaminomethyl(34) synthesis GTPase MnmE [Herbaspirillum sp.]